MWYNVFKGDDIMQKMYKNSLQMIKILQIKNVKQYNNLLKYYLILNIQSLKIISGHKDFRDIIKLANKI